MPAALIVNVGELDLLDTLLAERLFVRLWRNDYVPVETSTLDDFDAATFPGYSDTEVTGLWAAAALNVSGYAVSSPPGLTWVRGPGGVPEIIYGWLIYHRPAPFSVLTCARRNAIPWSVNVEGAIVALSLTSILMRG